MHRTTKFSPFLIQPSVISLRATHYHFLQTYTSHTHNHTLTNMGGLGPYLEYDGEDYICSICDRYFRTDGALFAQCRATTRHEWCERCRRVFISEASKNAHIQASNKHHPCRSCREATDFESNQDLRDHLVGYHHACLECNIFLESAEGLRSHDISDHCLCDVCDKYFSNENNLRMVS